MSATFRAMGSSATGTTSLTLNAPASAINGDVLLAFVVDHATSGTSTAPTGWTNQVSVADANGRFQCFIAKVGTSSLGSATSWSFTGLTTTAIGIILAATGVDPATPTTASSARSNASGTTGTTTITPAGTDALIVAAYCSYGNGATWSAEAVATNPASITERSDNANGTSCSLAVCTGGQAGAAAATGASSATMSANTNNAGILIALNSTSAFTYGGAKINGTMADSPFTYGNPKSLNANLSFNFVTNSPVWGAWTMDSGEVGQPYQEQWYLEGCSTPVTFTVVSGSLPPGLSISSINPARGQIAGTPTTLGTYNFTLRATNSFGQADQAFSIVINSVVGGGGSYTFVS